MSTASTYLSVLSHLTERDRSLLTVLDRHQVLTTGQIHRLYHRLTHLPDPADRVAAARRPGRVPLRPARRWQPAVALDPLLPDPCPVASPG